MTRSEDNEGGAEAPEGPTSTGNAGESAAATPDEGGAATGSSKKERVLHTRVPAMLERELKRFADSLRVPVSNLVRAILEDAVAAADVAGESVEARLKRAAHQIEVEREKLKKRVASDRLTQVYAYQPVCLAQPVACAKCGHDLVRGERAHLGMTETPPRTPAERVFVCEGCLPGQPD